MAGDRQPLRPSAQDWGLIGDRGAAKITAAFEEGLRRAEIEAEKQRLRAQIEWTDREIRCVRKWDRIFAIVSLLAVMALAAVLLASGLVR